VVADQIWNLGLVVGWPSPPAGLLETSTASGTIGASQPMFTGFLRQIEKWDVAVAPGVDYG
jgi:hypothetical protein